MRPKDWQSDLCTQCGACCSYFRVQFYWRETEHTSEYQVPEDLAKDLDEFRMCMKGTGDKSRNRCVALSGKVGQKVSCQIYSNRPSPCRNFSILQSDGRVSKRCSEARIANGLAPLKIETIFPPDEAK